MSQQSQKSTRTRGCSIGPCFPKGGSKLHRRSPNSAEIGISTSSCVALRSYVSHCMGGLLRVRRSSPELALSAIITTLTLVGKGVVGSQPLLHSPKEPDGNNTLFQALIASFLEAFANPLESTVYYF